MKLTINKTELAKSLGQISAVIEKRNTIAILGNVKMWTDGAALHLLATDLDIEATTAVECAVDDGGATTVSADMLLGVVKKMPNGDIDISHDDGILTVRSGSAVFTLATLPVDDYPVMASSEYDTTFDIGGDELRRLFDMTSFAMSQEETRYYLCGVYFHVADGKLTTVATDGHRMAKAIGSRAVHADMAGVIVPRKTVIELGKVIDEDGAVSVSVSDTKIRFKSGVTTIVSKVIDGTFPDYTRVIPDGASNIMMVDSSAFAKVSDRVSQVASDRSRGVKINVADDKVVLSVNGELNSAVDELAVEYSGDGIERGFNSKYLAEIMSKVDGVASVSFGGDGDPCVIKTDGDDSALFILMPMRI